MKKNVLFLVFIFSFSSLAQTTYYWRTEASSGSWNDANSWWTDSPQLPGGSEILRFNNNNQTTMTNDLAATNRFRIFFDADASNSRTINGSTENTFYDYSSNKPKIENSSSATHTINFPIKFGYNPVEINPVNGNLVIGGNINNNGNYLDIYGGLNKTLTLNGTISGSGGISIVSGQTPTLILSGTNSFTGPIVINSGKLEASTNISSSGITLKTGTTFTVNENLSVNSLTLESGSVLAINSGKTLTINGTFTNSGATITGTIKFSGSAAQDISGAFENLTIDNANGVNLSASSSVSGSLTLTNGVLDLDAYNLTLGASATIGGTPSATSMVVTSGSGELRKTFTGTGSFTFPVGDNTSTAEYSPVTLDFTSGTFSSAYAGVKVVNAKHPNNLSENHFINRYWTVTSSGISSFSCDASFLYKDADIIGTESNLYCGKYSGSVWTGYGQAAYGENKLSASGVTGFSDFTGGESGAMPVELTSFSAKQNGNNVTLIWKTATETNNFGFDVEKSADSKNWNKIGFVQGSGNSNAPKDYSYTDKISSLNGKFYYRLKQIDNDGTTSFSKVVEVESLKPATFGLSQNYPNPFNPSTVIRYQIPVDSRVSVKVYNVLGNVVTTLQNGFQTAGEYSVTLDGSNLASGVYFYKIEAGEFTATKKMLLTK